MPTYEKTTPPLTALSPEEFRCHPARRTERRARAKLLA